MNKILTHLSEFALYNRTLMVYNMSMNLITRSQKKAFQTAFLKRAGINFVSVKLLMDLFPNVGFYIKDDQDRIITLNRRNCELSALKDEFDAIGRKSSDLFPDPIANACLDRDAKVRTLDKPTIGGMNYATVDRSPTPTIYSVFPLHDAKGRIIGTMCGFYSSGEMGRHDTPQTRLQPALDLMSSTQSVHHSLEQLAKACKMSVTHFRRLFRETYKETPAKYALRLRLNAARTALETTDLTVAAIAADTGFYDQSHFIKAFRRCYKTSPESYRNRHCASTGKNA